MEKLKKLDYFKKHVTFTISNAYSSSAQKKKHNKTSYGSWPGVFLTVIGVTIAVSCTFANFVSMKEGGYDIYQTIKESIERYEPNGDTQQFNLDDYNFLP